MYIFIDGVCVFVEGGGRKKALKIKPYYAIDAPGGYNISPNRFSGQSTHWKMTCTDLSLGLTGSKT